MALALPAGTRTPGAVRALEWSADGYVLACGWENGWAVWSVGGRCLACGMGMDQVGARFADAFMFGVDQLVGCVPVWIEFVLISSLVLGSWKSRAILTRQAVRDTSVQFFIPSYFDVVPDAISIYIRTRRAALRPPPCKERVRGPTYA
jgi:hypothetical protein